MVLGTESWECVYLVTVSRWGGWLKTGKPAITHLALLVLMARRSAAIAGG